jgi:acetate kinase
MEAVNKLAPLHNPANITGIRAAQQVLPNVPHCAVMDTAWHQTMPATSYMYALPYSWYKNHKVRRYGFHGTSYIYTSKRASVLLGKKPSETNLIIAHIGNGSSICAVKNGVSYDTSMGMTPLEGLVMGTRCGDMDPAVVTYMQDQQGLSASEMDSILNKKSGVLGITEKFIDRRDVQTGAESGDERCILARDMETYRIKKYIGAYFAALGRLDAVVFTAGVGEMNPTYRMKTLQGLEEMGIVIDQKKNAVSRSRNAETCISADNSKIKVFVIPTDEELVMTEDAYALTNGTYDVHTSFTYSFQSRDYRNKARDAALANDILKNPELKGILAQ